MGDYEGAIQALRRAAPHIDSGSDPRLDTKDYDRWLAGFLEIVPEDLAAKYDKMASPRSWPRHRRS